MTARERRPKAPAKTTESAGPVAGTPKQPKWTGTNPRPLVEPETHLSAGALLGYARTSRADQVLDRQRDALIDEGCERIFEDDGISGIKVARPGLDELLAYARPGDTIVIWALDRLGRRTTELLRLVEDLRERGVALRILTLGVDTGTPAGQMVLTIMAALAQMERSILIDRTNDGLEAARRRGRSGGRPPALTDERRAEVLRMRESGRAVSEIARIMAVSERTVRRVV